MVAALRTSYAEVLVLACARSPPELVTLLLDANYGVDGIKDDARKQGLRYDAARCGNMELVRFLLR